MASFGENLQREREMRGVTLQEISAATKISVRFLQALEGEEFAKLPGGIFTRSFIRAYAKYLGLDEERVLAEYQLVAQPRPERQSHPADRDQPGGQAGNVARTGLHRDFGRYSRGRRVRNFPLLSARR